MYSSHTVLIFRDRVTIDWEEVTQSLFERVILRSLRKEVCLHQSLQDIVFCNDTCEHQLGEGFCCCGRDFRFIF